MDSSMFSGITRLLIGGLICFIVVLFFIGYFVYDKLIRDNTPKIESKSLIIPEIKLTTDGKTIDTIYIYKEK